MCNNSAWKLKPAAWQSAHETLYKWVHTTGWKWIGRMLSLSYAPHASLALIKGQVMHSLAYKIYCKPRVGTLGLWKYVRCCSSHQWLGNIESSTLLKFCECFYKLLRQGYRWLWQILIIFHQILTYRDLPYIKSTEISQGFQGALNILDSCYLC